jgi:hypothetical protein
MAKSLVQPQKRPVSPTSRSVSTLSSISSISSVLKSKVKKSVAAITRPFKKAKNAIPSSSKSSAALNASDVDADNNVAPATPQDESEVEIVEANPEKELSM